MSEGSVGRGKGEGGGGGRGRGKGGKGGEGGKRGRGGGGKGGRGEGRRGGGMREHQLHQSPAHESELVEDSEWQAEEVQMQAQLGAQQMHACVCEQAKRHKQSQHQLHYCWHHHEEKSPAASSRPRRGGDGIP